MQISVRLELGTRNKKAFYSELSFFLFPSLSPKVNKMIRFFLYGNVVI